MNNKFGLDHTQLKIIQDILSSILSSKNQYNVYVFGSRATGKQRKYSDMDLLIEATPNLTSDELGELKDLFEESDLAIKIDVLSLETCLPEYLPRVQSEKVLWFKNSFT